MAPPTRMAKSAHTRKKRRTPEKKPPLEEPTLTLRGIGKREEGEGKRRPSL
jgi:hypothetical protein